MAFRAPIIVALALAIPAQASASVDAMFTEESVEVRADERLFTLMFLMNALGWSDTEDRGPEPLVLPVYRGLRKELVEKLKGYSDRYLPPSAADRARRFVAAHPAAIENYIEATLHISGAPDFNMGSTLPNRLAKLKGLDTVLRLTWKEARLGVLMGRYKEALIEQQRKLVSEIDKNTRPLVLMLKAKAGAKAAKPSPKAGEEGGVDDLFGSGDEGLGGDEGGTADASDATAELEPIAVSLVPLWKHLARLETQAGKRFEVVFGGERGDGTTVAFWVAMVHLRAAAGLAGKPVTDPQIRAAWALVTSATGRQGPDTKAPFAACKTAVAEWRAQKLPITEGMLADGLIKACVPEVQAP